MTQYTPESLLQDARLQAEALGAGRGVLIVEGETDKRLLAPRWVPISQVVVATNKALVLAAHGGMLESDRGRIICLVDCDDDVARGTLHGEPDLVITTHADMEADVLAHGAVRVVVAQLVAQALTSEADLDRVADDVFARAAACAIPLGRLRRAARSAGIALDFKPWDFDHERTRTRGTAEVDETAVFEELRRRAGLRPEQMRRIEHHRRTVREDYSVCNGKDVIAACAAVLRTDFRVPRRRVENLEDVVRIAGLPDEVFESWDVVRRVRRWEGAGGSRVFSR